MSNLIKQRASEYFKLLSPEIILIKEKPYVLLNKDYVHSIDYEINRKKNIKIAKLHLVFPVSPFFSHDFFYEFGKMIFNVFKEAYKNEIIWTAWMMEEDGENTHILFRYEFSSKFTNKFIFV
ncbi:MAG: hypothetical protein J7K10_01825 [Thermodesulfobacterium sp.]|nr:hypothetical protein [Thermodesulfobacterium sp.]